MCGCFGAFMVIGSVLYLVEGAMTGTLEQGTTALALLFVAAAVISVWGWIVARRPRA